MRYVSIYFYLPVIMDYHPNLFNNLLLLVVNIETERIPVKPRILNEAKVNILPLFHGTSPPNNMQCSLLPHISVTDVSICHNAS